MKYCFPFFLFFLTNSYSIFLNINSDFFLLELGAVTHLLLSAESTEVDVAGEGDHVLDQGGGGPAVQAADGNSIWNSGNNNKTFRYHFIPFIIFW